MNRIVIIGTVSTPKIGNTKSGRVYATFDIVSERGSCGEDRFEVVAWDEKASEIAALHQGDRVRVRGTVRVTIGEGECRIQVIAIGVEALVADTSAGEAL